MNWGIHNTLPTWGCAGCQHKCGTQKTPACRRLQGVTLPQHHATLAPKRCPLSHATGKGATLPFADYVGTQHELAY